MTEKPSQIKGVVIHPLKQISDERGAVLHMVRCDSPLFTKFGEIYFSQVNPGVVKAWKRHKAMSQHFAVPVGRILLVLYDDRADSPSKGIIAEHVLGMPDNYVLFRIPPMVWYGFQGIYDSPSLIANCTDLPHDPSESERLDIQNKSIPYIWKLHKL